MNFLASQRYALGRAFAMVRDRPMVFALAVSLASLSLAVPLMLASIGWAVWPTAARVQPAPEVSVFIAARATTRDVDGLKNRLTQKSEVVAVSVRNKDAALAQLAKQAGFTGLPAEFGGNPLPDVLIAQLAPTTSANTLEALATEVRGWPLVDAVRSDLDWYRKVRSAGRLLAIATALFGGLTLLLLALVLFGTVRLHAATRADEIAVLRLSGATRRFIVRPYAYSAALTLVAASVISTALLYAGHAALRRPFGDLAALYGGSFALPDPQPPHLLALWVGAVLLGWLIGAAGARLSLSSDR